MSFRDLKAAQVWATEMQSYRAPPQTRSRTHTHKISTSEPSGPRGCSRWQSSLLAEAALSKAAWRSWGWGGCELCWRGRHLLVGPLLKSPPLGRVLPGITHPWEELLRGRSSFGRRGRGSDLGVLKGKLREVTPARAGPRHPAPLLEPRCPAGQGRFRE